MLDINELIEIVKKDGEFLKSAVLKSSDVHEKSGHVNFVTKYDLASQKYLLSVGQNIISLAKKNL